MKKFKINLSLIFLFTLLASISTTSFAYFEKVKLTRINKDDKVVIKTQNHELYLLDLALGCHDIYDFVGKHIKIESSGDHHPAFGLINASSRVTLNNGQSCHIWDATLIGEAKKKHSHISKNNPSLNLMFLNYY